MADQAMFTSRARVALAKPERFVGQLCKHFANAGGLPTTLDGPHGQIEFEMGKCVLDAASEADALVIDVTAADQEALAKLEDVVERHLARFAFREQPSIEFIRA